MSRRGQRRLQFAHKEPYRLLDQWAEVLRAGRPAPLWVCREVLSICPAMTFTEARERYRKLARMCCPKSGRYDRGRHIMLRTAWKCLRKGKR